MTRTVQHIYYSYRTQTPQEIADFLHIPVGEVTDTMNREGWFRPLTIEDEPGELFCWKKAKEVDFIFRGEEKY